MNLVHVLSEKQFLPHVYDLYYQFKECFSTPIVIRLLGEDRKVIEKKTNEQWISIVEEKDDIEMISRMISDMSRNRYKEIYVNVNNHYEGSAPLTIKKLNSLVHIEL